MRSHLPSAGLHAFAELDSGDLARATKLSTVTIRAFERGGEMRESNRTLLRLRFEQEGVEFIPENGGGPGVRLKKRETDS